MKIFQLLWYAGLHWYFMLCDGNVYLLLHVGKNSILEQRSSTWRVYIMQIAAHYQVFTLALSPLNSLLTRLHVATLFWSDILAYSNIWLAKSLSLIVLASPSCSAIWWNCQHKTLTCALIINRLSWLLTYTDKLLKNRKKFEHVT